MNGKIIINTSFRGVENYSSRLLALMINFPIIDGIFQVLHKGKILGMDIIPANSSIAFNITFIFLTCFLIILGKDVSTAWIISLAYFSILLISLILCEPIEIFLARGIIYFIMNVFCIILLFKKISDIDFFIDNLKKYIPISVLYTILELISWSDANDYDMRYTYAIAVPLLISLLRVRENRSLMVKTINSLLVVMYLYTIFRCGSRAGVLYFIIALFMLFIYEKKDKKIIALTIITMFVLVLYIFRYQVLAFMMLKFPASRTIGLLNDGLFFYDASRFDYYRPLIKSVLNNPFTIRGLYSDRIFMGNLKGETGLENLWGCYSHNVYLEILYQFGFFAVPVLIVFTCLILRTIFKAKEDAKLQKIVIIFFPSTIFQLMVSSSYLISASSGILVGITIYMVKNYNAKKQLVQNNSLKEAGKHD